MAVKLQHQLVGWMISGQARRNDGERMNITVLTLLKYCNLFLLLSNTLQEEKKEMAVYAVLISLQSQHDTKRKGRVRSWGLSTDICSPLNWINCKLADRTCGENFGVQNAHPYIIVFYFILSLHQVSPPFANLILVIISVAVALKLNLHIKITWEALKTPLPSPHPKIIKSVFLEVKSRLQYFLRFS